MSTASKNTKPGKTNTTAEVTSDVPTPVAKPAGKVVKKQVVKVEKEVVKTEANADKRNNDTRIAGLQFDVRTRGKWIKEFLGQEEFTIEKTIKDGKDVKVVVIDGNIQYESLRSTGAEYALASIEQELCIYLLSPIRSKKLEAEKAGLYNISHETLCEILSVNNDGKGGVKRGELLDVFGNEISLFDATNNYVNQLLSHKTECSNFVENYLDMQNYHVTESGLKFLNFLFLLNRKMLTKFAYKMVMFAGRKTVSDTAIMVAAEMLYGTKAPIFYNQINTKYESIKNNINDAKQESEKKKNTDGAQPNAEEEEDENVAAEEVATPPVQSKATTKQPVAATTTATAPASVPKSKKIAAKPTGKVATTQSANDDDEVVVNSDE